MLQSDRSLSASDVLIAKGNAESLYAFERVQDGIYALCKLANWVTTEYLEAQWHCHLNRKPQVERQCIHDHERWWQGLELGESVLHETPYFRRSGDCVRGGSNSLDMTAPGLLEEEGSVTPQPLPNPTLQDRGIRPHIANEGDHSIELPPSEVLQDTTEILAAVRAHYQEALYKSKTSLAYFAKGPLSRARASFASGNLPSEGFERLTEVLRSLILSLNLMDKKYRETLPGLVRELPTFTVSEDEIADSKTPNRIKVRKSKQKLGKDGLYPMEQIQITQWWLSRIPTVSACDSSETRDEATTMMILEQRARETQLQIILVLEVLALEATAPTETAQTREPGDKGHIEKKQKRKKQQNLNMLLDLFIDRLSIWQSMDIERNRNTAPPQKESFTPTTNSDGSNSRNDHLREFCIDVVLPL